MKKIITIHLAEKMFQIEEDAYTYLNSALSGQWKKLEIEKEIAEKLQEKLHAGKNVITFPDIVDVLYQLGFPASEGQTFSETFQKKKLYRQLDDKILGGVCSGLAEYFEIDTVLVRVLFVIAFFFCSMGFWLYIILWIIMPKTPKKTIT
jgi:Putative stress-responsive transcriptional regulator